MALFLTAFLAAAVCGIVLLVRVLRHRSVRVLRWLTLGCFAAAWVGLLVMMGDLRSGAMLTALLLGAVSVIAWIVVLVRAVAKKPKGKAPLTGWIALGLAVAGLFGIMASDDLSTAVMALSLAFFPAAVVLLLVSLGKRLRRRPARRSLIAALAVLSVGVGLFAGSFAIGSAQRRRAYENRELQDIPIQTEYDLVLADGEEPIEVLEYTASPYTGSSFLRVYDSEYLYLMFGEDEAAATPEACKERIRSSTGIPERFKDFFCDFVDRMTARDPDVPLDILYHNLETLRVEELNQWDYFTKSLSTDSLGAYHNRDNAIYIPEGTRYIEGEFGFQVLIHEFCHAARICRKNDDQIAKYGDGGDLLLLEECMNTVYSCSLLKYEERDLAYQVPSNYLSIMLECMDNFAPADYMRHGDTWFLRRLDEAAGYTNYAEVLWKLIDLQRSDWESDKIDIPIEEYDPIYEFIGRMYYDRYITEDMTREEAEALAETLVERAFYDAPEDYPIRGERFYTLLDEYFPAEAEAGEAA